MKLYRVSDTICGVDSSTCIAEAYDTWFTNLEEAVGYARMVYRDTEENGPWEVTVERIVLVNLPPRKLAIHLLNRTAYIAEKKTVFTLTKEYKRTGNLQSA